MTFLFSIILSATALGQQSSRPIGFDSVTETKDTVHIVTFNTNAGKVKAYFPADTAAGDTISGLVLAEPAADSPAGQRSDRREQNLSVLTGYVLDVSNQSNAVQKEARARWVISPTATGSTIVNLKDRAGRVIGTAKLPIAASVAGISEFDLPSIGQAGAPLSIKGPLKDYMAASVVTVGDVQARILAQSPRMVVAECPSSHFGMQQLQLEKGSVTHKRAFRVVGVRLTATKVELLRGETATLSITVLGLQGITSPITMKLTNATPTVISVSGGLTQDIMVPAHAVRPDGTYTEERTLTGIRSGSFDISAALQRPPSPATQQPVVHPVDALLERWQRDTSVVIHQDAQRLIRIGFDEARGKLDRLMKAQSGYEPNNLIEALVRHYCFDRRDEKVAQRRAALGGRFVFAFQSQSTQPLSIHSPDVEGRPFQWFLERFDDKHPHSYLDLTSQPELASITLNNQFRSWFTNRSAVVPVGSTSVRISLPSAKLECKRDVKLKPGMRVLVSCPK